jgi:hypothetical protein
MLVPNGLPWQAWSTGDTITATIWQNLYDAAKNADKKPSSSQFLKDYWYLRSCKELLLGDDYTGVLSGNTTISIDSALAILNDTGVKCLVNSAATSFYNGFYKSGLSWDLLSFNDGSVVTSDKVAGVIAFYFSDISKFTNLYLQLGSDSSNYYSAVFTSGSLQNGWNLKAFSLSSMGTVGSPPDFDNISYFSMYTYNNVSGLNSYLILDHFMIMRVSPTSTSPYSLQQSDCNDTVWTEDIARYGFWFSQAEDTATNWGRSGITRITSTTTLRAFDIDAHTHRNFYVKVSLACKNAGKTMSIVWYVDSDNYIEAYVDSNTLYITRVVAASSATRSVALGASIVKNAQVDLFAWKEGSHFGFRVETMGVTKILEYSHISTSEGYIAMGLPVAGAISFVYNWEVSHNPFQAQESYGLTKYPILVKKVVDQGRLNTTTVTDDDDLKYTFKEPGMYKIEGHYHIDVDSDSLEAGFKFAWTFSGSAIFTQRGLNGPGYTNTSSTQRVCADLGTAHAFGIDSAYNLYGFEEFLVNVTVPGTLVLQWAQQEARAAITTTLKSSSHIIITKMNGV